MDPVIYILDTNVIADRIHRLPQVLDLGVDASYAVRGDTATAISLP